MVTIRAVGRSENPGVPVLFVRHNLPPLVEIGLTDLPKSGGPMAPLGTPRNSKYVPMDTEVFTLFSNFHASKLHMGKFRIAIILEHCTVQIEQNISTHTHRDSSANLSHYEAIAILEFTSKALALYPCRRFNKI